MSTGDDAIRVLIIDDDVQLSESLGIVLDAEGFAVRTAANGNDALESFEKTPADVVICDLFMPEKDGLQTITELRRKYPSVKIIAMTGGGVYGMTDLTATAKRLGADRAYVKPLLSAEILKCIGELT